MNDNPMTCDRCGEPHALCSAHNRAGRPCGQKPMVGQRVCRMHGGKAPQSQAAAEKRVVEAQARRVLGAVWDPDAAPVTDPIAALRSLSGRLEHAADVLGSMLGGDGEACEHCGRADVDLDSPPAVAWTRVLRELRQSLEGMARLGIEERQIQLEQERAQLVVAAFKAALEVVSLVPAERALMLDTYLERLGAVVPGEVVA